MCAPTLSLHVCLVNALPIKSFITYFKQRIFAILFNLYRIIVKLIFIRDSLFPRVFKQIAWPTDFLT